jgi:acyl-CoA thioesterase FadM
MALGVHRVALGIADIDGYDMLFYSNYLRYTDRAANMCLPADSPPGTAIMLKAVLVVKYSASARWNDLIDIRTILAAPPVGGECTLLSEWVVGGKTIHTCLATYTLAGEADISGIPIPSGKPEERRVFALQRESSMLFSPPAQDYRRQTFRVFPDMVGKSSGMSAAAVFDFFERQRTELIGGQAELERLSKEDNTMIVVYSIQKFELYPTQVRASDVVEVSSGWMLQNDIYFCVHQSVSLPSGEKVAEGHLKLVFARDGTVGKAPAATVSRLAST